MDFGRILLDLLVVLIAGRLAAEAAERARQPAVLAEIAMGVLIGPSILALVGRSEILHVLGEIGAILLLFEVGREMDLRELRRVGGSSLRVATIGVLVPMGLGYVAMRAAGVDGPAAIFLGAGITATSVGITARVFGDLRALARPEARTVLGAAVADDVMGLVVLAVVTRTLAGEGVNAGIMLGIAGAAIGFVVAATLVGSIVVPRLLERVAAGARAEGTLMAIGLAVALSFARVASAARLAPIVGAFVAGLAVGRGEAADDLHRRLTPLGHLLIPLFFLGIGMNTDIAVFTDPSVLGLAALLSVVAIAGKLVSGVGVARADGSRLLVGVGMIPRGEVGLIFAGLGLTSGVLDHRTYGVLVAVVMISTIVAPPWLRSLVTRTRRTTVSLPTREPADGWLTIDDEEVDLRTEAPADVAPRIAIEAAVACATRRPGRALTDWLGAHNHAQAVWDEVMRDALFALLRDGNARSWRFLEVAGMLPVLLPDLAEAIRRRPRDPFDLDPLGSLRFETLDALNRSVHDDVPAARAWTSLQRREPVLLAALARSALEGAGQPGEAASRIVNGIGLEQDADLVASLVEERHLLPAAAARADALNEENVLELAAHLGERDRVASLYLLAVADDAMERWERQRLDELFALIWNALAHPDLTGASARDLFEQRSRAVAAAAPTLPNELVASLLRSAPRTYLLSHPAETVAKHLRMTQIKPVRGEVRLEAEPGARAGTWRVHIALLDRPGALASITSTFAEHEISVLQAWVSTWTNGIAMDVFEIAAPPTIEWSEVRRSIETAPEDHRDPVPLNAAEVWTDDEASPWYTIVEIRADDRMGLLARAAAVMSSVGVQIHHATVTTRDGVAIDTFRVRSARGDKLEAAARRRLEDALLGRTSPTKVRRRRILTLARSDAFKRL